MNEYRLMTGSRVNLGSMVSHFLLSNPAAAACQFLLPVNKFVYLVRSPDKCRKALRFADELFLKANL